ncbi:MAG TPA: hypothetical protein VLA00_08575 [Xanthobacteraceae bacterium]|nr:hypothetical protein [Xanthobacteraceae bacterium]
MLKDRSRTARAVARRATGLLVSAALFAASAGTAQAASFLEKNFWLSGPNYDGIVPACDTPDALKRIATTFAQTEARFWNSSLKIDDFDRVHQIAFRPWGEEYQPRRYCEARVLVSDKRWRTVYYSIIEDGGFIGFSWGVEWCVTGLDRNYAYAPNCRMAKP